MLATSGLQALHLAYLCSWRASHSFTSTSTLHPIFDHRPSLGPRRSGRFPALTPRALPVNSVFGDELPCFAPKLDIVQGEDAPSIATHGAVIILAPQAVVNLTVAAESRALGKLWLGDKSSPIAPYSDHLARAVLARNRPEVNPEQELSGVCLMVDLPNDRATRAILVSVKEDSSTFQLLELAGKATTEAMAVHPSSIMLVDCGLPDEQAGRTMDAALSAILASCGPMPTESKSERKGAHGLKSLSLITSSPLDKRRRSRVEATAEGTNLCRYLTTAPPTYTHGRARAHTLRYTHTAEGTNMYRYPWQRLSLSPSLSLFHYLFSL